MFDNTRLFFKRTKSLLNKKQRIITNSRGRGKCKPRTQVTNTVQLIS